jgi:UDP-2,4-diacetamido-2,4,6-trideoxy-beta-L-altropyranose hydrolase
MHEVKIRKAQISDCHFYWSVNNRPAVRAQSISSDPIAYSSHETWFSSSLARNDRMMLIANAGDRDIGVVRFDLKNNEAVISLAMEESSVGKGYASEMISIASVQCGQFWPVVRQITAFVKPDNIASQKSFLRAKYCYLGDEAQSGGPENLGVDGTRGFFLQKYVLIL